MPGIEHSSLSTAHCPLPTAYCLLAAAMTLKSLIAAIHESVFLSSDYFCESILVTSPAGGSQRTITALWTPDQQEVETEELSQRQVERVWLTVYRNATTGILRPVQGLRVAQLGDENPAPFLYQGQVRDETDDAWSLLFVRPRHVRLGPRERA